MDKRHCISAGNSGFIDPRSSHPDKSATGPTSEPSDEGVYDRLYQVPWKSEMAKYGYDGTHLTIGAKDFVAAYLAPLVKARQWNAHFVAQLPKVSLAATPPTTSAPRSR